MSGWARRFTAGTAALGWAGLAIQFYVTMSLFAGKDNGLLGGLSSYFSFFTVLTNLLAVMALTASLRDKKSIAMRFFSRPSVQSGIASSIALVGTVYTLFLRNVWDPQGIQLVANILLHYLMPVLFVIFWWIAVPARNVAWSSILRWMLYPIAYFAVAMVRGVLSDVYPYPFIDADQIGVARAFGNACVVLLCFIVTALLLVATGRRKRFPATDTSTGLAGSR
jgi:hypothetical protein